MATFKFLFEISEITPQVIIYCIVFILKQMKIVNIFLFNTKCILF